MKVVGLFAGVGGIELGLANAGHETVGLSEISLPAVSVLSARMEAPNLGDICAIKALPGDIDLLTGGFPCQDLSQAGRTVGIQGERSGLVDHVFRLLDQSRTDWVLLENVSFMLRLDGGRAMRHLVEAFEARGYRWAYRVINTLAFLPQRRERVFFLASRVADPAGVLLVDDVEPTPLQTSLTSHAHGFYWTEGIRGLGWGPDCIPTLKNGSTVGIPSPPAILLPGGDIITPDITDAERLQGFPADWTAPASETGRSSLRWALVGNAVSVPVATWLGERLAKPGTYDQHRDVVLPDRWPTAARFDGRTRSAVSIGTYPAFASREPLHQFLLSAGKPLSSRATAGFLSRTRRSKLRFQPGFIDALERHLSRMTPAPAMAA
jgi:DNA (cytosine-5)-methyltransferase 1